MLKNVMVTLMTLALLTITLNAKEVKNHVVNMGTTTLLKEKLSKMSTKELEIKVEECTQKGTMPFEMGVELINRWTQAS